MNALTALLLTSALGFLAASFAAPTARPATKQATDEDLDRELAELDTDFDDVLEGTR